MSAGFYLYAPRRAFIAVTGNKILENFKATQFRSRYVVYNDHAKCLRLYIGMYTYS